ncbi:MAG: Flagellar protein FlgJ-like protein [Caulobacteraceae bacterium]|jgi:flagellar protein FlgJ|nr:Flagellar protein FlgJ-like protein [Caulobacteraceae bacterium]
MTTAQTALAPTMTPAQAAAALLTPAQRDALKVKIGATAKSFETSFIATMMGSMFKDVNVGGGQGGEAFKSVMMDAIAKKISNNGGIGLAPSIQAEMLKLQGLS